MALFLLVSLASGTANGIDRIVIRHSHLEFVTQLDSDASARAVDSPARIAVKAIENILKSHENACLFVDPESAAKICRCVTRQIGKKRNRCIVVDPWKNAILNLLERFARGDQNAAGRAALSGRPRSC